MRFRIALTLALIAAAAGCKSSGRSGPVTIRAAFPTAPDVNDVPAVMALERLRQRGYDVRIIYFASPDLGVAALADGRADIGHGAIRGHWSAIAKGARMRTVMEQAKNAWSLVTHSAIRGCTDLDGKRLAVNSPGSLSNALLQDYLKESCPSARAKVLFISGSDNRSVAMQRGEADGALLELSDVMELERDAQGRNHTLVDFAKEMPNLATGGVHVTDAFAKDHPDVVREYIETLLTVHREIKSKRGMLASALGEILKMEPDRAARIADAYLARNLWLTDGGLTPEAVATSLRLYQRAGAYPDSLTAEQVADPTFLQAVLTKIGR